MRFQAILTITLALLTAAPSWAATAITELKVDTKSENVKLTVSGNAALDPKVRMVDDKKFLELKFSPAVLKSGKKQTMPVDKGLIRRVELDPAGDSVVVRVYVVSKPKSTLSRSADGKTVTYTVSTVEMAQAPVRPAATNPAPRPPVARGSVPPPPPPAPPVPAPASAPDPTVVSRPISITASNTTLVDALRSMAHSAGLSVEVHPAVQGTVNVSFTDIPLGVALDSVLTQQATAYTYEIVGSTLRVYPRATATPAVPSGRVARDYFPFKDRKASEMLEAARRVVPNLTYYADDRLNVLLAEGDPADLERLHQLLGSMSRK